MDVRLKRGLALPGTTLGHLDVIDAPAAARVAIVGLDFRDLKPSIAVSAGDRVAAGDVLFTQRGDAALAFVAPGSGRVAAVNRGARRSLVSVVIELADPAAREQPLIASTPPADLDTAGLRQALQRSGWWTSFRTRPFDRVPGSAAQPRTLFVSTLDRRPYAYDPEIAIALRGDDFRDGLTCLSRLEPERLFVCTGPDSTLTLPDLPALTHARFSGKHPAGAAGTHIGLLDPGVSLAADSWYIGHQDVIALGAFFRTGRLDFERIVSVAGPGVRVPCLLRTRLGADAGALLTGEDVTGQRVVSGSLLDGRQASAEAGFLGRYHHQLTLLPEARVPGGWRGAVRDLLLDLAGGHSRAGASLTTARHGAATGMLPVEAFDTVWPLPSPPGALLRALLTGDAETARALGCLALGEEDMAPCSYVCPAKQNYGQALRDVLAELEKRG